METITAYHCSLFIVYQTVTACYDEYGSEFYFSLIKYAIHITIRTIPIPILISSLKLLPFPWESHGNPMGMGILILMHISTRAGPVSTWLGDLVRV